ncbi:hypothetical protein ACROYT_G036113 [Oculina patagonica]
MEAFTASQESEKRIRMEGERNSSSHQSLITSYWDRLPEELRQQIQWMADFQHAEERLFKGWDDIHELFDPCGHCGLFKLYEGRVDTMGNLISKSPRMWWKATMTPSAQCFHCWKWFHTRCMNLHVRSPDHPATSRWRILDDDGVEFRKWQSKLQRFEITYNSRNVDDDDDDDDNDPEPAWFLDP